MYFYYTSNSLPIPIQKQPVAMLLHLDTRRHLGVWRACDNFLALLYQPTYTEARTQNMRGCFLKSFVCTNIVRKE